MITRLEEKLVLDNGFIRVFNDKVSFNGESEGYYFRYSLAERFPNYGVAIICEFEDKIYLQEIFRYAPQEFFIETVKGMGMNGKTPAETAAVEVREETGGIIESIEEMGAIKGDLSDFPVYCFLAKIKSFGETEHEDSEFIQNLKGYTMEEVKQMVLEDKMQDTATMAIILKYLAKKM